MPRPTDVPILVGEFVVHFIDGRLSLRRDHIAADNLLARQEKELLSAFLVFDLNTVVSKEELRKAAGWKDENPATNRGRVDRVLCGVRKKLGKDSIKTHFGDGLSLNAVRGGTGPTARSHPLKSLGSVAAIAERTLHHLEAALTESGHFTGWSHHLHDGNVSAIGSAYGLRIIRLANVGQPAIFPKADKIVRSILRMRSRHLWRVSSRTSEFEATAWTLRGLLGWVEASKLEDTIKVFAKLAESDEMVKAKVSSLSLALSVLAMARPDSKVLATLTKRLSDGRLDSGKGLCWGKELHPARVPQEGSAAHTAHAVLALLEVHRATGGRHGSPASELEGASQWLLRPDTPWDNDTEDISRNRQFDTVTIHHFTAPWVVRALLALGADPTTPRVIQEVQRLASTHNDGLWDWTRDKHPIWATHDALAAVIHWLRAIDLGVVLGNVNHVDPV